MKEYEIQIAAATGIIVSLEIYSVHFNFVFVNRRKHVHIAFLLKLHHIIDLTLTAAFRIEEYKLYAQKRVIYCTCEMVFAREKKDSLLVFVQLLDLLAVDEDDTLFKSMFFEDLFKFFSCFALPFINPVVVVAVILIIVLLLFFFIFNL